VYDTLYLWLRIHAKCQGVKIEDQKTSNTERGLAETQEVGVNKPEMVENQHSSEIERELKLSKTKEESSKN
jgi:hypothetical protein